MIGVQIDAKNAIAAYARLKHTSVYAVLFHAMKDFVGVAYKITPIAKFAESNLWAVLPKDKYPRVKKDPQYVRIEGTPKQINHLLDMRVKVAQKWSMGSWIAAMRMLKMGKEAGGKRSWLNVHLKENTVTGENIFTDREKRRTTSVESIALVDRIWFSGRPGTEQAIMAAGEAKAAYNIARNWDKEIRKKWGVK